MSQNSELLNLRSIRPFRMYTVGLNSVPPDIHFRSSMECSGFESNRGRRTRRWESDSRRSLIKRSTNVLSTVSRFVTFVGTDMGHFLPSDQLRIKRQKKGEKFRSK